MKFGLLQRFERPPDAASAEAYRAALARCGRAEQLGYDAVWLDGKPSSTLPFAGALAAQTRRLKLGLILEPPLESAAEVAMLDLLSRGRTVFGAWYSPIDADRLVWAAGRGRRLLFQAATPLEEVRRAGETYRAAIIRTGHDPALADKIGLVRAMLLAGTDADARRAAGSAAATPVDLVGSPETVAARLAALQTELGDCRILLDVSVRSGSPEQTLAALERFSREILPLFGPQPLMPPTFA